MTGGSQVVADGGLTCIAPGCTRPPSRPAGSECTTHGSRRQRLGSYDLPVRPKRQPGPCAAEGCDRQALGYTNRGIYCSMHIHRVVRHGTPVLPTRQCELACTVGGCERPRRTRGLCNTHYTRLRRTGDIGTAELQRVPGGADVRGPDGEGRPRCSVDGCTLSVTMWRDRLCNAHYCRRQRYGTTDLPPKPPRINGGTCSVQDCAKIATVRGMCSMHNARLRATGTTDAPPARKHVQPTCAVDGCARSTRGGARGWCTMHFARWQTHGNPLTVKSGGRSRGDNVGYMGAHSRVKAQRGAPSEYACVDCGQPARDWAYTNSGIGEKVDDRGYSYSVDVTQYDPMCRSCHSARDWLAVAEQEHGGRTPTCAAPGCTRPPRTRTAVECDLHYRRRRARGSYDLPVRPRRHPAPRVAEGCDRQAHCSVRDCTRPVCARSMCGMHYQRWLKYGDPLIVKSSVGSPLGDAVGYVGAHIRVRKERGHAADFSCVDCGRPAAEWAYTNSGVGEKVDDRGQRYSIDTAQYAPKCRLCHRRQDKLEGARRRRAAIAASGSSPAGGTA